MVKAKENKKVVGSYKTIAAAAEAMIDAGKTATQNVAVAAWNIRSAINGSELRDKSASSHKYSRHTAYGYVWSETATAVTVTKTSTKKAATKAPSKTAKSTKKPAAKKTSKKSN